MICYGEKCFFCITSNMTHVVCVLLTLLSLWSTRTAYSNNITQSSAVNFHYLPGLIPEVYAQPGDINIGAVMIINDESSTNPAGECGTSYAEIPGALEITEAVAFAVNLVNQDPNLLPNVSLGFVVRGSCYSKGVSLAASMSFVPRSVRECNETISSFCSIQPSTTTDPEWLSYDVIGVLPPPLSSYTIPVSSLLAVAELPMLGYVVTSDDLSDKTLHPYFFRIIPPDKYQIQAILKFINTNGWSYISVIYEDDSYGNGAYGNMQQNAGRYGICIATSHRLFTFTNYEDVVDDLLENSRARAVVVFTGRSSFRAILQNVINKNATGHFIWIAADSLHGYPGYEFDGVTEEPAIGAFLFDLYSTHITAFYDYLRQQRIYSTQNPWMKDVWEILFGCSFEQGTCDPEANIFEGQGYQTGKDTPLTIDAVLTLAHAAHNLLAERCPDARGQDARDCITGRLLFQYMKNLTFDGFCGPVEFDENQDVKGRYIISQFVHDYYQNPLLPKKNGQGDKRLFWKRVGLFDVSTETITYFNQSVSWSHLNVLDRIVPWDNDSSLPIKIPESVCSRPCILGEYRIEKKLSCCWECRRCRDNERLVEGNTSCEACPPFMWPDPNTAFTTCADIPNTYQSLEESIPIVLTSLAVIALFVTVLVFIAYIVYREERVIKASSKELSVIQLLAILTGYTTIILFQTTPTNLMCSVIFFTFCMSFVLLYSPLLVKTIRIYRIFKSGKKNEKPSCISPSSQVLFADILIIVQILLCVATYIMYGPGAHRTQPIWSEKLVEMSCDLTLPGLASFLGYNIVLVSLCSALAFTVRKLPDNFNESKFIMMCVATTLLIWLAFIPTYFTADREYVKVFLLSTALLLNHSVALIFLFLPKIYAAIRLPTDAGNFSNARS